MSTRDEYAHSCGRPCRGGGWRHAPGRAGSRGGTVILAAAGVLMVAGAVLMGLLLAVFLNSGN
ncbi:hypothetical protein ACIBTP_31735 [Streptomyces avidinii]|uniref:hypothetical protein n=1 Tax=Streptomyces avidinii TaxID=1895 RepID=UPI00379F1666